MIPELTVSTRPRLLGLGVALILAGCSGAAPNLPAGSGAGSGRASTGSGKAPAPGTGGQSAGKPDGKPAGPVLTKATPAVMGEPLSLTAAAGGRYITPDGSLKVQIPPGALDKDARVRFGRADTAYKPVTEYFVPGISFAVDLGGATLKPGASLVALCRIDDRLVETMKKRDPAFTPEKYSLTTDADGAWYMQMVVRGPLQGTEAPPPKPEGDWKLVESGSFLTPPPPTEAAKKRRLLDVPDLSRPELKTLIDADAPGQLIQSGKLVGYESGMTFGVPWYGGAQFFGSESYVNCDIVHACGDRVMARLPAVIHWNLALAVKSYRKELAKLNPRPKTKADLSPQFLALYEGMAELIEHNMFHLGLHAQGWAHVANNGVIADPAGLLDDARLAELEKYASDNAYKPSDGGTAGEARFSCGGVVDVCVGVKWRSDDTSLHDKPVWPGSVEVVYELPNLKAMGIGDDVRMRVGLPNDGAPGLTLAGHETRRYIAEQERFVAWGWAAMDGRIYRTDRLAGAPAGSNASLDTVATAGAGCHTLVMPNYSPHVDIEIDWQNDGLPLEQVDVEYTISLPDGSKAVDRVARGVPAALGQYLDEHAVLAGGTSRFSFHAQVPEYAHGYKIAFKKITPVNPPLDPDGDGVPDYSIDAPPAAALDALRNEHVLVRLRRSFDSAK